jgi:hypothetical protein
VQLDGQDRDVARAHPLPYRLEALTGRSIVPPDAAGQHSRSFCESF